MTRTSDFDTPQIICASCHVLSRPLPGAWTCEHCGDYQLLAQRYALINLVGQGATGKTYRAVHVESQRQVAIKELWPDENAGSDGFREIQNEVNALAAIEHPGIPRLIEHRRAKVAHSVVDYLVREYVRGESLGELSRTGPLSARKVFLWAAEILDILAYLHGQDPPLVHGDLKPDNVLIRDGDSAAVLLDFGSAVRLVANGVTDFSGTSPGGTAGFMAPEYAEGHISEAADLYGVGAVVLRVLGRRQLRDLMDLRHRVVAPTVLTLPKGAVRWIEALLRPDPAQRPSDARAVANAARAIAARLPDRPLGEAAPWVTWVRRWGLRGLGVGALVGALIAGALAWGW